MKKITNLTGSSFLPLIAIILLIQSSPIHSQTYWNNQGAKIYIGGKGVITGTNTTVVNDSNTVIVNHGTIKVTEMQNQGNLELKGTAASIIIDSTLVLEKGKILLNANKIILKNADTVALQRVAGYLIAEDSLWGKVRWLVGEEDTGKFIIPFFTDSLEDVSMEFEILQAGEGANGYLEFSTYTTPNNNNPKPTDLNEYPYASENIKNSALKIVDRFWIYNAVGYEVNPIIKLTIRYSDREIAEGNSISEDSLIASVLENLCWGHWRQVNGSGDTSQNKYLIDSLKDNTVIILHGPIDWNDCNGLIARKTFREMMNQPDPNYYVIVDSIERVLENLEKAKKADIVVFEEEEFGEFFPKWRHYWEFRVGVNDTNPGSFLPAYKILTGGSININTDCDGAPQWKFEGPDVDPFDTTDCTTNTNGRRQNSAYISQVWVNPTDHDHIIAAIPSSGLWETNNGAPWKNISKGINNDNPALSYELINFAVQPGNPDLIFVSTSLPNVADVGVLYTGIYYTDDGGDNWHQDNFTTPINTATYPLFSDAKIQKIKFSPSPYQKYLYAIGLQHVFRKDVSNLSNSWEEITECDVSTLANPTWLLYKDIEFDQSNPNRAFICLDEEVYVGPRGKLFFSNNAGSSTPVWTEVGDNFRNANGVLITNYSVVKVSMPNDSSGKIYALLWDWESQCSSCPCSAANTNLKLSCNISCPDSSCRQWNNCAIYEADMADQPSFTWTLMGEAYFPYGWAVHPFNTSFTASNSTRSSTGDRILYIPMHFFYYTDDFFNTAIKTNSFNGGYDDCNKHADIRHLLLLESDTTQNAVNDLIFLATDGGVSRHPSGGCNINTSSTSNSCFQNLNQIGLPGGSITDIDYDPFDKDYLVYSGIHGHFPERKNNGSNNDWYQLGCGDAWKTNVFYANGNRYVISNDVGCAGFTIYRSSCATCPITWSISDNNTVATLCNGTANYSQYRNLHCPVQVHPNGNIYLGFHNLMVSSIDSSLSFINISSGSNSNANGYDDYFNPPSFCTAVINQTATHYDRTPARIGGFDVNESNDSVIYLHFTGRAWRNPLGVIKSEDGGTTWENLTPHFLNQNYTPWGGPYDLYAITDIKSDPNNADKAWISFAGFPYDETTEDFRPRLDRIWRTCDGGDTWSDVSTGLPEVPVYKLLIFKYNTDVVFAATAVGVYMYVPGSSCFNGHWECISNGLPPVWVVDLEFDYCKMKLLAGTRDWGIWSWNIPDELIQLQNENLVIDANTEWDNETRRITGNIIIESGNTLEITNGSVVNMPRTGRIIVERGAKLIVDSSTISNSCDAMWQGIEVWGNPGSPHPATSQVYNFSNGTIGSYPTQSSEQGVLILINGAVIENARQAVECLRRFPNTSANLSYTGGIVIAENCTLRNNITGVGFNSYTATNYTSEFRNCLFETDGDLNDPAANPYAFVTMWNVHGIKFFENTFINQTPVNYTSRERGTGIIMVDARAEIKGVCYAYSANDCVDNSPNLFENLYTGIRFVNTFGHSSNSVAADNSFINNFYGVDLQGAVGAQVYRNYFETAVKVNNQHSVAINGLCSYNIKLEENEMVIKPNSTGRGIYFEQSQGAQRVYKNTVSSTYNLGYAFAYGSDNSNLVNECNQVENEMYHFMVFENSSIFEKQGDCDADKPAGNIFDGTCNSTNLLHFYTGQNAAHFEYCYNATNEHFNPTCVIEFSPFDKLTTSSQNSSCPSGIIIVGDDPGGYYGKRAEQETLTGLIKDQYALLDGGRTKNILDLVHDENYNANQLRDTLLYYTPFLSDVVLSALLFRNEFSVTSLSHILIENAPHSNLIWKAIAEENPPFNADSLEKLIQYQDSTSARKDVLDSLSVYKLQKALNYSDMLYIASVDTNYSDEEVKDSLKNEKDIPFRLLLGDLHMKDAEYYEADTVYNTLKVYFHEDKQLIELREIQTSLFKDTLTYFDLDSATIADIEEIAFNDTSIAAFQALGILEFLRDTIYTKPYHDIDSSEGSSKTSFGEPEPEKPQEMSQSEAMFYKLFPTVIAGKQVAFITLASDEDGYLQLYRIEGKQVSEFRLSAGTNQIQLSELNLSEGIYIYRVYVKSELKNTGKIVKVN